MHIIETFRGMGLEVDAEPRVNGIIIKNYPIPAGRHAGRVVDLALGVDLPVTPPAGLHVRAPLGTIGVNGVNPSPLGGDWQYWSRRHGSWRSSRSEHSVLAYINRILADA